jgi:hypothetical protein
LKVARVGAAPLAGVQGSNLKPFQDALRAARDFAFLPRYGIWASGRFAKVREVLTD